MEDIISVIIPVYNTSLYLRQCLDSVIAQTYRNLEIILVDDGSTDDSGKICEEYAANDDRIQVIHKENGGLSDARNAALEVVSGQYITFIDSDDYVDKKYIEVLAGCAKKEDCDFVEVSYIKFIGNIKNGGGCTEQQRCTMYTQKEAMLDMLYRRKIKMYSWGKLYKAHVFSDLRFPKGKLFEDMPTTWSAVKKVSQVAYMDLPLYFYRQRSDSIVNSKYSTKKMDQRYIVKDIMNEVKADSELFMAAISKYFFCLLDLYTQVDKENMADRKILEDEIRYYRGSVLRDKNNNWKMRLIALISCISFKTVKFLGKIYKTRNIRKWEKI